jgi:DNA polymerase V
MSGCSAGEVCGCNPARPAAPAADGCSGGESFALMVLGDSMAPEFTEGEIVIIEPDGATRDGSFVLAFVDDKWIFRQLRRGVDGAGDGWRLQPLNPAYAAQPLPDLAALRGVIIQKALPGRRRASKRYV